MIREKTHSQGATKMRYILTDWAGTEYGDKPRILIFKNKDDLIEQLMKFLDDDITLEVKE